MLTEEFTGTEQQAQQEQNRSQSARSKQDQRHEDDVDGKAEGGARRVQVRFSAAERHRAAGGVAVAGGKGGDRIASLVHSSALV